MTPSAGPPDALGFRWPRGCGGFWGASRRRARLATAIREQPRRAASSGVLRRPGTFALGAATVADVRPLATWSGATHWPRSGKPVPSNSRRGCPWLEVLDSPSVRCRNGGSRSLSRWHGEGRRVRSAEAPRWRRPACVTNHHGAARPYLFNPTGSRWRDGLLQRRGRGHRMPPPNAYSAPAVVVPATHWRAIPVDGRFRNARAWVADEAPQHSRSKASPRKSLQGVSSSGSMVLPLAFSLVVLAGGRVSGGSVFAAVLTGAAD